MNYKDDAVADVSRGRDEGVSRRTIVKGAAWSVPVIVTAAAVPMVSASNNCAVTLGVTGLAGCGTAPLTLTLKNEQGAPVPNGTVSVTLPAGLVWADTNVSGARTITIVNGVPTPAVSVKSTGPVGNLTISAVGLTPCTTPVTQQVISVAPAAGGRIWYRRGTITQPSVNADPNGTVPNPVHVYAADQGANLYALSADGGWYISSVVSQSALTWTKISAPPMQLLVMGIQWPAAWGLTPDGDVYFSWNAGAATLVSSPVKFTQLFMGTGLSSGVFGITADGVMYSAVSTGGSPGTFTPVMTTVGNVVGPQLPPVTYVNPLTGNDADEVVVFVGNKVYATNSVSRNVQEFVTTASNPTLPANPKDYNISRAGDLYVIDADGSLWVSAGGNPALGMKKVTTAGIPPLDSFIGRAGQGTIAKAANGDLIYWASNIGNVQNVANVTPTGFSVDDIAQVATGGDSFDRSRIMVRLTNGDVWRWEGTTWVKWDRTGVTDIYASRAGNGSDPSSSTYVMLTDGSTTCA